MIIRGVQRAVDGDRHDASSDVAALSAGGAAAAGSRRAPGRDSSPLADAIYRGESRNLSESGNDDIHNDRADRHIITYALSSLTCSMLIADVFINRTIRLQCGSIV